MPPSVSPMTALRVCAFRPRQVVCRSRNATIGIPRITHRTFAEDKSRDLPKAPEGEAGPNMNQQEHVSEEAAKMAKIQGGQGPDIEGQATPVQEILRNEKDVRETAPKVMKEQAKSTTTTTKPSTRAFSTLAIRPMELMSHDTAASLDPIIATLPSTSSAANVPAVGHKFPLPPSPLPRNLISEERYDPVVTQVTNLMMRDGKKSAAQRNMATILTILRTSPAPTYRTVPSNPLLPGAPPAHYLPQNPIAYLTLAIDSVAPLLRIRSQKGAAGGGVALQIPVPLGLRQRRRTAFMWILDAASKKKSRGSGKHMFAQKVAEEIIAVVEGRSGVWEKRIAVHKLGTTARSNISYGTKRR